MHLQNCAMMCAPKVVLKPVLTGCCLREAAVLHTEEVAERFFVRRSKSDSTLTRFLTGKRAKVHPLKDSSLFSELVLLRNEAGAQLEPLVMGLSEEVDDLGLDLVEDDGHRRKRGYSKLPSRIVTISLGGSAVAVLSGYGNLDVYMEATNENMAILHRAVSTELGSAKPVSTACAVPQPASALPAWGFGFIWCASNSTPQELQLALGR